MRTARRSAVCKGTVAGATSATAPLPCPGRHARRCPHELGRHEGQIADQHHRAKGHHSQANADAQMQRHRQQQHPRASSPRPDQHAVIEFPEHGEMGHEIDGPRPVCQPRHVQRLIFEIGERLPHRGAVPPAWAHQFRSSRECVDHAHMQLHQADGDVRADAGLDARDRIACLTRSPDQPPPVERIGSATRAHGQIGRDQDIDLVEAEEHPGTRRT